jgi:uncharacterized DUF497 family protein
VRFQWDTEKEKANVTKHGVDFSEATAAFYDPQKLISTDEGHSAEETRFSASVAQRAGSWWFVSPIAATPFGSSAPVIGGKAGELMKKKTRSKVKYTDDKGEIQGELRIVRRGEMPDLDALLDKLPDKTKVTLELDNSALEFFKREARKRNTSYQRMIRNLVRSYAQSHT